MRRRGLGGAGGGGGAGGAAVEDGCVSCGEVEDEVEVDFVLGFCLKII